MNKYANDIPNKIKQPSLCCINCGKGYKKRVNLDKHLVICELLQISKTRKNSKSNTNTKLLLLEEDEEEPLPSQRKLFQMLIELGEKYTRLEEKLDELNKWVVRKKKKINVLEWLNANTRPNLVFENVIDTIIITEEDIKNLFEKSFYDVMNDIFSRTIYNADKKEAPIVAFTQKQGVFYIYDNNNSNLYWIELSKERLTKFLIKVHTKVLKAFYEFKNAKKCDNKLDAAFSLLCDKTIVKLMSVEFTQENIFSKVRNAMYSKLKTDIKTLVEYEMEI